MREVPAEGGPSTPLPFGPALGATKGPRGQVVLCRHVDDLARWKRYRGGRTGALWVDRRGKGQFERLLELEVDEELSVGDFVLSGGEIAAMLVVEAMTRLLPGALGHEESARSDSFANGLLDCPHYTRPEVVEGLRVPAVLRGGDHEAIRRWRLKQALGRTWQRRPELLHEVALDDEQRALLDEFIGEQREALN